MKEDDPRVKAGELNQWIEERERSAPPVALVDLSVVVPAYNEYRRLPSALMEIIDYLDRSVENATLSSYEIIVVDDGSSDGTSDLVKKFERIRPSVRLIRLPKNRGKGHAVRLGVQNARGKRILFADADGATPFEEYEKLNSALNDGHDVAIGSRAARSDSTRVKTVWYRKLLGRIYNSLVNIFILPDIADTQCGFKIMRSDAARFMFELQRSDRFSFDVEILFIARKSGISVKEVPINWTNVPGSKVNLVVDSLRMLRDIFIFQLRHSSVTPEMYKEFKNH